MRGEVKRDCPLVPPFMTLNKTVGDKPINEAYRARVRQAKNASQLVVGRAEPISDDDQCSRRFAGMVEDVARRLLDTVGDSKPDNAEQIGSTVHHLGTVCAARTLFNLTICALRT